MSTLISVKSGGNSVTECDLQTRKLTYTESPFLEGSSCMALSPDGAILAVGHGGQPYIRLYYTDTWTKVADLAGIVINTQQTILSLAFKPDGSELVLGTSVGGPKRYSTTDWNSLGDVANQRTDCLAFSPDGSLLVVCGIFTSNALTVYDTATWSPVAILGETLPFNRSSHCAFSPDGSKLIVGSTGISGWALFIVYDTGDWVIRDELRWWPQRLTALNSLAFNPEGTRLVVTFSAKPYAAVLDTSDWSLITTLDGILNQDSAIGTSFSAPDVIFNQDGSRLFMAVSNGPGCWGYRVNGDHFEHLFNSLQPRIAAGSIQCSAMNAEATTLAIGSSSYPFLHLFNLDDWSNQSLSFDWAPASQLPFAMSPDGALVALGYTHLEFSASKPMVRIFNRTTWEQITSLHAPHWVDVRALDFSPDGSLLAVGMYADPQIMVFNVSDWSLAATGLNWPKTKPLGSLSFSQDGAALFAIGSEVKEVKIYRTADWSEIEKPSAWPDSLVASLDLSEDGLLLAVGCTEWPYLYLFNTSDGSVQTPSSPPNASVNTVRFGSLEGGILFARAGNNNFAYSRSTLSRISSPALPSGAIDVSRDRSILFIKAISSQPLSLYSTFSLGKIGQFPDPGFTPSRVETTSNHELIAISGGRFINVYRFSDFSQLAERPALYPASTVRALAFNPDDSLLAISNNYDNLIVLNTEDWSRVDIGSLSLEAVPTNLAFSPDGKILAVRLAVAPYLVLVSVPTWSRLTEPSDIPAVGTTGSLAFKPDGSVLAVSGSRGTYLALYNTQDWSLMLNPASMPEGNEIQTLQFSPDGNRLFIAWRNNFVSGLAIYDTRDWSRLPNQMAGASGDIITSLSLNYDGSILAAGGYFKLWLIDTEDWTVYELTEQSSPVDMLRTVFIKSDFIRFWTMLKQSKETPVLA